MAERSWGFNSLLPHALCCESNRFYSERWLTRLARFPILILRLRQSLADLFSSFSTPGMRKADLDSSWLRTLVRWKNSYD